MNSKTIVLEAFIQHKQAWDILELFTQINYQLGLKIQDTTGESRMSDRYDCLAIMDNYAPPTPLT